MNRTDQTTAGCPDAEVAPELCARFPNPRNLISAKGRCFQTCRGQGGGRNPYFRVITYEPLASSRADHFGSMTIVVVTSSMMAGPLIVAPAPSFDPVIDRRIDQLRVCRKNRFAFARQPLSRPARPFSRAAVAVCRRVRRACFRCSRLRQRCGAPSKCTIPHGACGKHAFTFSIARTSLAKLPISTVHSWTWPT